MFQHLLSTSKFSFCICTKLLRAGYSCRLEERIERTAFREFFNRVLGELRTVLFVASIFDVTRRGGRALGFRVLGGFRRVLFFASVLGVVLGVTRGGIARVLGDFRSIVDGGGVTQRWWGGGFALGFRVVERALGRNLL